MKSLFDQFEERRKTVDARRPTCLFDVLPVRESETGENAPNAPSIGIGYADTPPSVAEFDTKSPQAGLASDTELASNNTNYVSVPRSFLVQMREFVRDVRAAAPPAEVHFVSDFVSGPQNVGETDTNFRLHLVSDPPTPRKYTSKLSIEQRREIARKNIQARWAKLKSNPQHE